MQGGRNGEEEWTPPSPSSASDESSSVAGAELLVDGGMCSV